MPHLSPMNWIFTIMVFWMILVLMMTSSWWLISPKIPSTLNSMSTKYKLWNWM